MKKVIFISALAIAAAVSCTKSDIVDTKFNEAIGFESYIGRDAMTKASVVDASNIGTAGIYGFYTGANPWTDESKANLWDNAPLNCTAGTVNPAKYWTNDKDQYTFLAYAPQNGAGISEVPENTGEGESQVYVKNPTITYTVDADLPDQIDLTYAIVENITKEEVNAITGDHKGQVPMNFKHALARLTVNASKSSTETNFDFIVKKIEIEGGFITSDVLTLATGLWTKTGTPATEKETYTFYDVAANKTPLETSATKYAEHVKDGELPDNYLMMIPVDFSKNTGTEAEPVYPNAATLRVVYTTVYQGEESTDNEVEFAVATNFEAGKAYAINLVFSKKTEEIKFYVTVDYWDDVADDDADDDLNNDEEFKDADEETPINGGNPVEW